MTKASAGKKGIRVKVVWTVVRDSKYKTIRAFVPSDLAAEFESLIDGLVKQLDKNQFSGEIICACK